MNRLPTKQKGASIIATILVLAVLSYGVYIGIQYVPQFVESKSIGSILSSIRSDQKVEGTANAGAIETKLIRMLQINEMDYMKDSYSVRTTNGGIVIKFSYDRELDLVYKIHKIHYERLLTLD